MTPEFFINLPKVELHAHINGSISENTMAALVEQKGGVDPSWRLAFKNGESDTLESVFKMFKLIHKVTDTVEAVYKVTYDVIHEFAAENVKYLELRTTPRSEPSTGMTKLSYVESVIRAIQDCSKESLDIIVRLILAIDRRHPVSVAMETVNLAAEYREKTDGLVVGIDFSGDPNAGDGAEFIPVFEEGRRQGLKLALHLAEVPAPEETWKILQVTPDRIGHGTCLQPDTGGSKQLEDFVTRHRIPLELCLTSNIVGKTVEGYDNHHFQYWYDLGHPCVICTDDKGVFSTTLSREYSIAAETFSLSDKQMWDLSYRSIDFIFSDEHVKHMLRKKWTDSKDRLSVK
ncbi:adenosine deaminase-like protein isoform X1 [Mya arenaria]|nr:adenosine deaminase-like protein isoform X1 [Mya arenaria]